MGLKRFACAVLALLVAGMMAACGSSRQEPPITVVDTSVNVPTTEPEAATPQPTAVQPITPQSSPVQITETWADTETLSSAAPENGPTDTPQSTEVTPTPAATAPATEAPATATPTAVPSATPAATRAPVDTPATGELPLVAVLGALGLILLCAAGLVLSKRV